MKVSTKGQVTIPKPVREALNIQPGDKVEFDETEDGYVIRKVTENPFERWTGVFGDEKTTFKNRMRELHSHRAQHYEEGGHDDASTESKDGAMSEASTESATPPTKFSAQDRPGIDDDALNERFPTPQRRQAYERVEGARLNQFNPRRTPEEWWDEIDETNTILSENEYLTAQQSRFIGPGAGSDHGLR